MKFDVLNRFSGKEQFIAEIDCSDDAAVSVKLGLAVKWAVKARANLAFANLDSAYLAGANLARANLAIDAGTPNGWRCVGWLRDGWLSVRVGCHDKRIDEGRAYWVKRDDRREVLAALDYVEAVAKLRGWALKPATKEAA